MAKSLEEILNEIAGTLGRLEGLQSGLKDSIQSLKEGQQALHAQFENLPCEDRISNFNEALKRKVNLVIFMWVMGFVFAAIAGSYTLSLSIYESLHQHELKINHGYEQQINKN